MKVMSSGKTFLRVKEELSWLEALQYCRRLHTDLADLQSMDSVSDLSSLYALTSSTEAWIGLFFDVRIHGLSWSSGSTFTVPKWSSLPTFKEGICATLYSVSFVPSLGAALCTAQKPFICYYGAFRVTFWAWPSSRGCFSRANEGKRTHILRFSSITIILALFFAIFLCSLSSYLLCPSFPGVPQGKIRCKSG